MDKGIKDANVQIIVSDEYKVIEDKKLRRNYILYAASGFVLGVISTLVVTS